MPKKRKPVMHLLITDKCDRDCKQKCISNYRHLLELKEKGYYKDLDTSIPIHKILESCEVIEIERK